MASALLLVFKTYSRVSFRKDCHVFIGVGETLMSSGSRQVQKKKDHLETKASYWGASPHFIAPTYVSTHTPLKSMQMSTPTKHLLMYTDFLSCHIHPSSTIYI